MNTAESTARIPPVVLASASVSRKSILENAGLAFTVDPAHVDEEAIKIALHSEHAAAVDAATMLAETKALRISPRYPGALVIGADQILDCGGEWFDKPKDMKGARTHLQTLRGKTHVLATSACIVRDGERIWHHVETPKLTMRPFSDEFLETYLDDSGEKILTSVGAYLLEGRGVQLFSRIDGDFFSILGLPLLALLGFLREYRVVQS